MVNPQKERKEKILILCNNTWFTGFNNLVRALKSSNRTVRRDLDELIKNNLLFEGKLKDDQTLAWKTNPTPFQEPNDLAKSFSNAFSYYLSESKKILKELEANSIYYDIINEDIEISKKHLIEGKHVQKGKDKWKFQTGKSSERGVKKLEQLILNLNECLDLILGLNYLRLTDGMDKQHALKMQETCMSGIKEIIDNLLNHKNHEEGKKFIFSTLRRDLHGLDELSGLSKRFY